MQRDEIRLREQLIQFNVFIFDILRIGAGRRVIGADLHPESTADRGGSLADRTEADKTEHLAVQFHQRLLPIRIVLRGAPVAIVYGVAVTCDSVTKLQNQRKCQLRDRSRPVGRDIGYRNPELRGGRNIYDVITCCDNADKFQVFQRSEHIFVQNRLI